MGLETCLREARNLPERGAEELLATRTRKVDIKLPEKGDSNSYGARPVHQIISTIKWIQTSRLPIKNSLSGTRNLLERGAKELLAEVRDSTVGLYLGP